MSDENESVVRTAYEAYGRGEPDRLLELVHPDLAWTYLDPSMQSPQPHTCHGRAQLAEALAQEAGRGFASQVEVIGSSGDKVMVAVRTPGAAQRHAWQTDDLSYLVLTVDQGRITALRNFRDSDEAGRFAGLGQGMR